MSPERAELECVAGAMETQLHRLIAEYVDSPADEHFWKSPPTGGRRISQLGPARRAYGVGVRSADNVVDPEGSTVTPRPCASVAFPTQAAEPAQSPEPECIRTFWKRGVWHVTKDNAFYGHYLEARPALHAAIDAALDTELSGGSARIVFGPPPSLMDDDGIIDLVRDGTPVENTLGAPHER